MLCQNCNKNEAAMHMKRIINGSAAEVHLCPDCARSLGYGEAFSGFGFGFGELLGELISRGESASGISCHTCGKSFDEIARDGQVGCADCYDVFYEKLLPYINRIHGRTTHIGNKPSGAEAIETRLNKLKIALSKAIEEQNFELAAQLRDEIIALSEEGGINQ